ncbi:hypothetical protein C8R43DRAFT_1233334 [Mycena crocata]|nr:hypothetical protein C8R43DRAFT_1233334 [Mycena crocata]
MPVPSPSTQHRRLASTETFLRRHSTASRTHHPSAVDQDDFDPYSEAELDSGETGPEKPPGTAKPRIKRRSRLLAFFSWPAFVICGQCLLQGFGWSFFAVVKSRRQIPLPLGMAEWITHNENLSTLIITLIATALASASSYLFSLAIRRSLSLCLFQPMSLTALGASINISLAQPVLQRGAPRWVFASLVVLVLSGIQTSAWSTLLMDQLHWSSHCHSTHLVRYVHAATAPSLPQPSRCLGPARPAPLTPITIVIDTPLVGTEVDLASPVLKKTWLDGIGQSNATNLQPCIVGDITNNYGMLSLGLYESGYAAAQRHLGYTSTLTVMNQTYNASTFGILPSYAYPVNVSSWLVADAEVVPPGLAFANTSAIPAGLRTNYSMLQQGVTADVSCVYQNLSDTTTPNIRKKSISVTQWTEKILGVRIPTWNMFESDCPISYDLSLNTSDGFATQEYGSMLMVACQNTDSYSLVFIPQSPYAPYYFDLSNLFAGIVCTMKPRITRVRVEYAGGAPVHSTIESPESTVNDPDGPAGLSAVYALWMMMRTAQDLQGSTVANQLTALNAGFAWKDPHMLGIMEHYIKGLVEYSGTILRTCLSANGTIAGPQFKSGVPAEMTIALTGTHRTQTLGWSYTSAATSWILVPGALIALASVIITIISLGWHKDDGMPAHDFDLADPLHLVGAAASGNLNEVFTDGKVTERKGMRQRVVLGWLPDKGPALLRSEVNGYDSLGLHSPPRSP